MKIAVMAFIGVCLAIAASLSFPSASYSETISGCRAVDGDTLNCQGERVRLLGIDAPELPGHCAQGRACAPGDPYASTVSLEAAVDSEMAIERVGQDRYGRTLAMVRGKAGDLSCLQLRHHAAIYKPAWDNGFRVARMCPKVAMQ